MITNFEQFVELTNELGFMTFSENPWGVESLSQHVDGGVWHTALEDDPWLWKNRIAEQGHALYGHVLGGRLGFVSMQWLPVFFSALLQEDDVEQRYEDGVLPTMMVRIAREMQMVPRIAGYQLRENLSITSKEKSKFDSAIAKLEGEMLMSIGGATRKRNKQGQPYGWHLNELWLCDAFYAEQIKASHSIDPLEARERISEHIRRQGGDPSFFDGHG